MQDIPWRISETRDKFFRTEFAEIYQCVRPYTMCSYARLRSLHQAVEHVIHKKIPGDVVECGAARGGSAAVMGLTLKAAMSHRKLFVFDTFEGLPSPTLADPDYHIAIQLTGGFRAELAEVEEFFSRINILERSTLVKG
ncbi:MAG TPA: TylF/MycF/NovP-related O-methyltransferase, partial [Pyrinomonadaceae bacterium]|nr:TylF/MycF/NovP-related O-methyltransferase [Pyrinomonadaceae bacterium]